MNVTTNIRAGKGQKQNGKGGSHSSADDSSTTTVYYPPVTRCPGV